MNLKLEPLAYKDDGRRKLMEEDISEIREMFPSSSLIELAQKFHVYPDTIRYWVDEDFRVMTLNYRKNYKSYCSEESREKSKRKHKKRLQKGGEIWRENNRVGIVVYQKLWYEINRENRKLYYVKNKERTKLWGKDNYKKNGDKIRMWNEVYYYKNRDKLLLKRKENYKDKKRFDEIKI